MGLLEKFKNTQTYLENYSEKLKKLLKLEIERSRSRNYTPTGSVNSPINTTGSLANSLSLFSKISSNKLTYGITGNSYANKLNEGKPQGTIPDVRGIIKWIRDKRITLVDYTNNNKPVSLDDINKVERIAYHIANKIAIRGTDETAGFIDKAIEDSMADLDNLGNQVGKDVSLNIEDILLKAGYIKKGENYEYKFES
jgi:hypothetical protein